MPMKTSDRGRADHAIRLNNLRPERMSKTVDYSQNDSQKITTKYTIPSLWRVEINLEQVPPVYAARA